MVLANAGEARKAISSNLSPSYSMRTTARRYNAMRHVAWHGCCCRFSNDYGMVFAGLLWSVSSNFALVYSMRRGNDVA